MNPVRFVKKRFKRVVFRIKYRTPLLNAASAFHEITTTALVNVYGLRHIGLHSYPVELSGTEEWLDILDDILFALAYIVKDEKEFLPKYVAKIVNEYIPKTEYDYEEDQYKRSLEVHTASKEKLVLNYHLNKDVQEELLTRYQKGWKYFTEYFTSLWD
jgi:hypothetical protein